jgi:hypothetical protein
MSRCDMRCSILDMRYAILDMRLFRKSDIGYRKSDVGHYSFPKESVGAKVRKIVISCIVISDFFFN